MIGTVSPRFLPALALQTVKGMATGIDLLVPEYIFLTLSCITTRVPHRHDSRPMWVFKKKKKVPFRINMTKDSKVLYVQGVGSFKNIEGVW